MAFLVEVVGMSQSAMRIGCPHCGSAANVDLGRRRRVEASSDDDQLKGKLVHCHHCGDDFSFYYY
ncbi:hypothetical protein BG842_06455 [Haladaptatus sp. W1]|uniref:hypothetical protein n=1 Tax=Haladaptatus sp. W1 TaxID=1897478 RepID=UPI0008498C8D|nr:hypothetical protein [Haladaptatus sp. W1]ODR80683.1 hypothetical protein BG842_06455 [Haladaptatus sp. W1]